VKQETSTDSLFKDMFTLELHDANTNRNHIVNQYNKKHVIPNWYCRFTKHKEQVFSVCQGQLPYHPIANLKVTLLTLQPYLSNIAIEYKSYILTLSVSRKWHGYQIKIQTMNQKTYFLNCESNLILNRTIRY
jgi:hypothetical protein